jgi:hypothetical protein
MAFFSEEFLKRHEGTIIEISDQVNILEWHSMAFREVGSLCRTSRKFGESSITQNEVARHIRITCL